MLKKTRTDIEALKILDDRLRWLSSWTIHHANHIRESADGLKVGGHQASCASMTAIMTALYFHALGENDRVAVKPHAGPVLHAIHYLLGSQSREALENFRGLGGAQSYPSRTKDRIPVDFSTGSVGLGVAITLFASLVQDYLTAHGWQPGFGCRTTPTANLSRPSWSTCLTASATAPPNAMHSRIPIMPAMVTPVYVSICAGRGNPKGSFSANILSRSRTMRWR